MAKKGHSSEDWDIHQFAYNGHPPVSTEVYPNIANRCFLVILEAFNFHHVELKPGMGLKIRMLCNRDSHLEMA